MILTPMTPGAKEARVFDSVTGEPLDLVCEIDTETMTAKTYRRDGDKSFVRNPDGKGLASIAVFTHPNPVRVEWPGGIPTGE